MTGDDHQGFIEMRTITPSKQMKNKTGLQHRSWSDILGRSYPLTEVIYLLQRSSVCTLLKICCFQSSSEKSQFEVLSWSRLPVALILNFFSCEIWTENGLPRVSLLYLLAVPGKVPYNEVQEQFSLMSLPIDKISWLKIIKRLFRKILWEGGLHLSMIALGMVHESLVIFCMCAHSQVEFSIEINH